MKAALASDSAGLAAIQAIAKADPDNTTWQSDLSLAYQKVGGVQLAQSDVKSALASFQASRDIMLALVKTNPDNAGWQSSLSAAYGTLGDVAVAQRNAQAALDRIKPRSPSMTGSPRPTRTTPPGSAI